MSLKLPPLNMARVAAVRTQLQRESSFEDLPMAPRDVPKHWLSFMMAPPKTHRSKAPGIALFRSLRHILIMLLRTHAESTQAPPDQKSTSFLPPLFVGSDSAGATFTTRQCQKLCCRGDLAGTSSKRLFIV